MPIWRNVNVTICIRTYPISIIRKKRAASGDDSQSNYQITSNILIRLINSNDFSLRIRRSIFETSQSLFWASFGLVDLMAFELQGIKSFTRFWAMLMFGSYSVINIIVLLNMLIAMMSNSYQIISVRTRHPPIQSERVRTNEFDLSLFLLSSSLRGVCLCWQWWRCRTIGTIRH